MIQFYLPNLSFGVDLHLRGRRVAPLATARSWVGDLRDISQMVPLRLESNGWIEENRSRFSSRPHAICATRGFSFHKVSNFDE